MNPISIVTSLLLLSLIVLNQPDFSNAECCSHDGNTGCCGNGRCNIFCCNCDGGCNPSCKFDGKLLGDLLFATGISIRRPTRGKRSTDTETYKRFIAIDSDLDGIISFNETIQWFTNNEPVRSKRSAVSYDKIRETIYLDFKKMDINSNNLIERNEFDYSLD